MKFQKFKEKLHNEKKLTRRIGGLFGVVLGLVMAFSFFPANQANALDVDISDEDFILLGANPADINYDFESHSDWKALGIHNNGATNHSPAQATHGLPNWSTMFGDYSVDIPRFHPKGGKSYNGKYGNRAYTLMDDSYGNKNAFKMLEVTDKSGDAGKKLRGTSKFYSGDKDWQRFEFEFVDEGGYQTFVIGKTDSGKEHYYIDGRVYKVHMRSEKTGNYIVGDGVNHGASMHVANSGDNIDLWMVVWAPVHHVYSM